MTKDIAFFLKKGADSSGALAKKACARRHRKIYEALPCRIIKATFLSPTNSLSWCFSHTSRSQVRNGEDDGS